MNILNKVTAASPLRFGSGKAYNQVIQIMAKARKPRSNGGRVDFGIHQLLPAQPAEDEHEDLREEKDSQPDKRAFRLRKFACPPVIERRLKRACYNEHQHDVIDQIARRNRQLVQYQLYEIAHLFVIIMPVPQYGLELKLCCDGT